MPRQVVGEFLRVYCVGRVVRFSRRGVGGCFDFSEDWEVETSEKVLSLQKEMMLLMLRLYLVEKKKRKSNMSSSRGPTILHEVFASRAMAFPTPHFIRGLVEMFGRIEDGRRARLLDKKRTWTYCTLQSRRVGLRAPCRVQAISKSIRDRIQCCTSL